MRACGGARSRRRRGFVPSPRAMPSRPALRSPPPAGRGASRGCATRELLFRDVLHLGRARRGARGHRIRALLRPRARGRRGDTRVRPRRERRPPSRPSRRRSGGTPTAPSRGDSHHVRVPRDGRDPRPRDPPVVRRPAQFHRRGRRRASRPRLARRRARHPRRPLAPPTPRVAAASAHHPPRPARSPPRPLLLRHPRRRAGEFTRRAFQR